MERKILRKLCYPNPADNYLYLVLAYLPSKREFVVWTYNDNTNEYFSGHYFSDGDEATEYFKKRYEKLVKELV